jgi:predicted dehydrogenase
MYVRALATRYARTADIVALVDVNEVRMAAHNRLLERCGAPPARTYRAADFDRVLRDERIDTVLVTSVDRTHDEYIVGALDAGCDAVTEKPMTVDAPRCRRILDTVRRTGRDVRVTFNYRYNPVHEAIKRILADGEIGEIGSVHFEWLLDVRHGADYFRRWHRDKANSGGLMVHKASHHFDLVNWWLGASPVEVYASGRLFVYGEQGARHGYDRGYARAHGAPAAQGDPFALHLADHNRLRELYLDAEADDGYLRDRSVFAPGVTIEDDMAVLARYDSGATMTYHLTAYAPWEGYRIAFNGSRGRLELTMVESDRVDPAVAGTVKGESMAAARRLDAGLPPAHGINGKGPLAAAKGAVPDGAVPDGAVPDGAVPDGAVAESAVQAGARPESAALHGDQAAAERGWMELTVRRLWEPPRAVEVPGYTRGGHGGADARMVADLFGGDPVADDLGRGATARDGAQALLTGLAANESFRTGQPVRVADLLAL